MIRSIFRSMLSVILTAFFVLNALAQDDTYYTPPTETYSAPAATPSSTYDDKTDGYGLPAEQYTSSEASGNTYITNNYYDSDMDDWGYTSRMRRYYTPNYGVNYYSYWFTPSYYYGWNTWNTGIYVSIGNSWIDPFWGRGNRWGNVGFYDPWYDPFWSYNWGWNSYSYYNTWNYGGGFCSTPFMWGNHGWGGGGWCGNRGWGGSWNNGYNNGWNNGYNNGWNNGYWAGYNDGYWNSPYAYGGGWGSPYWKTDPPANNNGGGKPNMGELKPVNATLGANTWTPNSQVLDIPKEGITRPITEMSFEEKIKTPVSNTKGQTGTPPTRTETEYTGKTTNQNPVAAPTTTPNKWSDKSENTTRWNGANSTVTPAPSPTGGSNNTYGKTNGNSNIQQNENTPRPNVTPTPRQEQPKQYQPSQQPRQQVEPRQQAQPTPRQEQPKQYQPAPQPRQQVEPRQQAQPTPRQEQPKQYQPAQQPRQQQIQPSQQSRPQISPSQKSGGNQSIKRQ